MWSFPCSRKLLLHQKLLPLATRGEAAMTTHRIDAKSANDHSTKPTFGNPDLPPEGVRE